MKKKTKSSNQNTYVMYGFEEANPQNTAYLKIETDGSIGTYGIYSIVNSSEYATRFPEKNYCKKEGFGTPWQWAEFFAEEEDLQAWNFHPVICK